jgi:hypothetical protein
MTDLARRWIGVLAEELSWLAATGRGYLSVEITCRGTASSVRLGLSPAHVNQVIALLQEAAGPDEPSTYAGIDVLTSVRRGIEEPERATKVEDLLGRALEERSR